MKLLKKFFKYNLKSYCVATFLFAVVWQGHYSLLL